MDTEGREGEQALRAEKNTQKTWRGYWRSSTEDTQQGHLGESLKAARERGGAVDIGGVIEDRHAEALMAGMRRH